MDIDMKKTLTSFLAHKALHIRIDAIRATTAAKSGHPTSCMSAADILATLFFHVMHFDIQNPHANNNDRFILSKGHAIPMVYAAYKLLGVISDEELLNFRRSTSVLEGHPTPRFAYNEAATGSLGQGLAVGLGMALNARHEGLNYKTFVMMGDAEIAEGSVWEAAELAPHYQLDNLVGIVDCNRLGQSGESMSSHHVDRYAAIFKAFGWEVFTIDGHNLNEIIDVFEAVSNVRYRPSVIIAKTFKGYGLASIVNKPGYHGKPFKEEELPGIIKELKANFDIAGHCSNSFDNYIPPKPIEKPEPSTSTAIVLDFNADPNQTFFDVNKKIATRKAFGYALVAAGRVSEKIFTLDADVKNSTFTEMFEAEHPDRFVQCFVAEQNMVGVATGLSLRGKIPFAATFAAFFTRAHDQIRMAGIGRNPLRLCGSHVGVSIGEDGPSQMGLEDIALFRSIPNSIVLYPSDGVSTYKLVEIMANYAQGVSYLRTTRADTPILYDKDEQFPVGGCKVLRHSKEDQVCIIGAGITLHESLQAHQSLLEEGIHTAVIDLYSVKPLDVKTIAATAKQANKKILIVEDHYLQGGIGEAVTQALSNHGFIFNILAVEEISRSGTPTELMRLAGIDSDGIVAAVKEMIKK